MIELEKLTVDRIHLIRKWRNHDRLCFRNTALVTHKQQEEWYRKNLRDLKYWYFVVIYNDVPVGCIGFSIVNDGEIHIENVILGEKSYAGRGIMGMALSMVMDMFPFRRFSLKVLKDNMVAVKFYQKNGFAIAREENGCYIMIKSE